MPIEKEQQEDSPPRRASELPDDRLSLLARVGDVFASSLDYETTLRNVIGQCLPALGDFGFFDVVEDAGVRRLALAHQDPKRQALLEQTRWMRSDRQDLNLCALSSGMPGIHPRIDARWLNSVATGPEHLAVMEALAFGSMITVPLRYERKLLGALTLFFNAPGRQHDERCLDTASEVARRAAAAVISARLHATAQAAIAARDAFLAHAANELRTPLTSMQLQVQSLLRALAQPRPLEERALQERLGRFDTQLGRLNALVEQLVDVGRLSGSRLALEPEPLELGVLLSETVGGLSDLCRASGCEVRLRSDGPLEGCWDRARLEQVFINLLTNALRFGAGKPIEIRAERAGERAVVRFRDHGVGIAPEVQPRIFERFERASTGGLGLGLWLVRELVDGHGGRVSVSSAPGEGATFTVELPFAGPAD